MYNLLLVDDEPSVVKGLAYDIEWSDLNIAEVYKAHGGTEAIRLMERTRIDIVVSDVSMPDMDGIRLTGLIRSRWPSAIVIFLSGYDEFEYAQKAVELGVFQYVTKPVDYPELKETVGRAVAKLEQDLVREGVLQQAAERLEQFRPLLRERALYAWIVKGTESPLDNANRFADAGLSFQPEESFAPVVLRLEGEEGDGSALGERGSGESSGASRRIEPLVRELVLKELAEEWLLGSRESIFFQNERGQWLLLVQAPDRERCAKKVKYMELAAERFKESVRRTAGCVVSIFFGEIAEADGLNVAYRKLNATARRTAGDETGVIVLADSLRETGLPHAGYSRLESLYMTPELVALLSNLDLRGSLARIELIFAEAEQRARLSDRAVWLEIYHVVSGAVIQASLQQGFSLSQWLSGNEPLLDPVRLDTRLAELKGWCRSIVNAFVGQMSNREKLQSNRLLEQTKRIVEEQYARDLTVAEIAAYLYVHPSYLTRVFKAGTGMSLIDYISRRRIEEAKLYLAQPGYKVYEVAGKVGYESIAHFNRMFKRETGMSPKDYQKTVALP